MCDGSPHRHPVGLPGEGALEVPHPPHHGHHQREQGEAAAPHGRHLALPYPGGEQGEQRWAWWGDGLANLFLHGQEEGGQGAGTGGDQGHENRGEGRPLPGALQLLGPLPWPGG